MNILVIGSGMVGTALAATLDERGHDVSVVDRSEADFDSLPAKFGGFTTAGVPIDQDVLRRAGIQTCDVLFAVTSQDDMNIMVSELARQMFNVPRIYARITDIKKGEVFEQLGVNIICPTKLTVSAACAALEEDGDAQVHFENHTVRFSTLELPEELLLAAPADIEYEEGEVLFGVLRSGSGLILNHGQPLNFIEGDRLIFAKRS